MDWGFCGLGLEMERERRMAFASFVEDTKHDVMADANR